MSDNVTYLPRPPSANHLREDQSEPYSGGGSGGGNLEARVRQLENDFAYVKGKLEDMPTKDWMTTRLIWVVGAFLAISSLVQVVIALMSKFW